MRDFLDRPARAHRTVRTPDGVNLSVREWGNPAGRPIVFIHGVMQSHLSFARQYASDDLGDFRLVAFDERGHGESDKPTDVAFYTDHKRWADDVRTVMAALELDRPILVGWSMGGRIIGQYLSVYGDSAIAGVNLVGARVIADVRFSGPAARGLVPSKETGLAADIGSAAAFLRVCFHQPPAAEDFAFMLCYNVAAWSGLQNAMRAWPGRIEEAEAALRASKVPFLITHGALDTVVLPSVSEYAGGLVPHARLSIYDGCGHSPFWEDSARFNRELRAFAQQVFA